MIEPSSAEQATWSDVTRDYVRELERQTAVMVKALHDIANWTDDFNHHWGDAGYRARAALKKAWVRT